MKEEYGGIITMLLVAGVIAGLVEGLSYVLGKVVGEESVEKKTAYECGFEAFEDARQKFDVRFYIVGMMFIVFDVETIYMVTCSVVMDRIGELGYWCMIEFIGELGIGIVYAWRYIEQRSMEI